MKLNVVDEYRQYRVPTQPSTSLIDPSLVDLERGLSTPHVLLGGEDVEFCGKPLDEVRRQAREEVVELALRYTRGYADRAKITPAEILARPIVLSGHQPELFHAGVWFKNFLLSRLADHNDAIAINFLVDNDLCRSSSIRLPSRNEDRSVVAKTAFFDAGRDSIPWEMRTVNSWETWKQFPQVVQAQLLEQSGTPLLHELWPQATEALRRTGKLGLALAEGRHRLEEQAGLNTLEVPLSGLVSTRAFARFSIQLLAELPRFQEIYNTQRDRYRSAHRIRNNAHPVPALEQEHGWIEAPWWVYRPESPYRHRLWVRLLDDQLVLSDRAGWQEVLEGRLDCDNASSQWLDLLADGVCIRPRALLTTMYLRLFVADLFVHGIGGGKYDQLTDTILSDFFGVEPPPMAVATATMRLPLEDPSLVSDGPAIEGDIRAARERLWQLRYHADSASLDRSTTGSELARRKKALLQEIPPRGERWKWHQEMTSLNQQLSALAADQTVATKREMEQLTAKLRDHRILMSREYSFCLYPQPFLIEHLKRLAQR